MRIFRSIAMLHCVVALLMFAAGCPSNSGSDDGAADDSHASSGGNDHGHSHAAPGPAGGHLLEIGEEEYHVEWVHDEEDDSVVEFIIRDEKAKAEVPISAEKLVLEITLVDDNGEEKTYTADVDAVGRSEENPRTARFELTDRIAIGNLLSDNKNVTTVLQLTIAGVSYEKEIEHGCGHGHSH